MNSKQTQLETRLIHAGEPQPRILGAGIPPIFRSTVWEQVPDAGYHDILYPRLSNLPNHVPRAQMVSPWFSNTFRCLMR